MGSYLAAGVMVKIEISKKEKSFESLNFNIKDHKDEIIEYVGNFIDLTHYNIKHNRDSIIFNMDVDYFNNNIHNDYLEFKKVMNLSSDSYKLDVPYNQNDEPIIFNKEHYPIILSLNDKNKYEVTIYDEVFRTDTNPFSSNVWMFYENSKDRIYNYDLFRCVNISISYVNIYCDIEKISIEDDRNLLTSLNLFCKYVFKNGLTKDIGFYIQS